MPKVKGLTDIIVILDRSGSMAGISEAMVNGLKGFVKEQQNVPGEARFTLVQFDSEGIDTVYDKVPIGAVKDITLIARGMTPLLDAIGRTLGAFKATAEKTIAVIITDGQENASTEWTIEKIRPLLKKFQKNNRQLVFLGANIDSFNVSQMYGINIANTRNFTPSGVGAAVMTSTISNSTSTYRGNSAPMAAVFDNSIPDTIGETE